MDTDEGAGPVTAQPAVFVCPRWLQALLRRQMETGQFPVAIVPPAIATGPGPRSLSLSTMSV